MIFSLLSRKIESGKFIRNDILNKMDVYLLNDRITEEDYSELVKLMNAREK